MIKTNLSNMVLRYYIGFENTNAETSSIVPEEYYKNHAELIRPYVEKLKDMGIETGINVLHTTGHCFCADEKETL